MSRKAVLDCLTATGLKKFDFILDARKKVNNLSPVTHTHGTCKDCKHCCYITGTKNKLCEKHSCMQVSNNWYCADFEKLRLN